MVSIDKLCSNLIPTGKYKCQVTDIKFKASPSGESTKDMVVNYTIVDGPCAKRTLIDTIYEKSFSFRLKPFLLACKVDTAREFATSEELFRFVLSAVKGKILMVDVSSRNYNGKDYNQISDFSPLSDSTSTADEVLESFKTEAEVKGHIDGFETTGVGAEIAPTSAADQEPELDIDLTDPF